jgi:hypothetical protein
MDSIQLPQSEDKVQLWGHVKFGMVTDYKISTTLTKIIYFTWKSAKLCYHVLRHHPTVLLFFFFYPNGLLDLHIETFGRIPWPGD